MSVHLYISTSIKILTQCTCVLIYYHGQFVKHSKHFLMMHLEYCLDLKFEYMHTCMPTVDHEGLHSFANDLSNKSIMLHKAAGNSLPWTWRRITAVCIFLYIGIHIIHVCYKYKIKWIIELIILLDTFMEKWSSSKLDIKVWVNNIVHSIEVTVVIFHEHIEMTVCEFQFKIGSEFEYHCFKRCMEGILISYCKH